MSKLSDLASTLNSVDEKLGKAKAEIIAKIDELQAALANVELPAEAEEALSKLAASAQGLDDVVLDAPAPEPPQE